MVKKLLNMEINCMFNLIYSKMLYVAVSASLYIEYRITNFYYEQEVYITHAYN